MRYIFVLLITSGLCACQLAAPDMSSPQFKSLSREQQKKELSSYQDQQTQHELMNNPLRPTTAGSDPRTLSVNLVDKL
jgi:hypothetical protein